VPEVTQFSSVMSKVTTGRAYKLIRDGVSGGGGASVLEFATSAKSDRSLNHWSFIARN